MPRIFCFMKWSRRPGGFARVTSTLGLGVNEGIARFKKKWEALSGRIRRNRTTGGGEISVMDGSPGIAFMNLAERISRVLNPRERILRTVWRAQKGGMINYFIGTAHFFPYHFRTSLKRLLRKREGPFSRGRWMGPVWSRWCCGVPQALEICEALDPEALRDPSEPGTYLPMLPFSFSFSQKRPGPIPCVNISRD